MADARSAAAEHARLFVAVELPDPVRDDLAAAIAAVRHAAGNAGLRWTAPAAWHLTLAFFGSVDLGRLADLEARLERAAHRHRALDLRVESAGRFGHRVLWAGVSGDRAALSALAASVGAAARRAGIDVDERPYRPHLTVARGAPGADLRSAVQALADYAGPCWSAGEVALVRSYLGSGPGGTARYEVIRTGAMSRRA